MVKIIFGLKLTQVAHQLEECFTSCKIINGFLLNIIPKRYQGYRVNELELIGLLANIHGFEQKLCNNYFEVIVDHKGNRLFDKIETSTPHNQAFKSASSTSGIYF